MPRPIPCHACGAPRPSGVFGAFVSRSGARTNVAMCPSCKARSPIHEGSPDEPWRCLRCKALFYRRGGGVGPYFWVPNGREIGPLDVDCILLVKREGRVRESVEDELERLKHAEQSSIEDGVQG